MKTSLTETRRQHDADRLPMNLDWLVMRAKGKPVTVRDTAQLCFVIARMGNLHERRLTEMLSNGTHKRLARDAVILDCPDCNCGLDTQVNLHRPSRALHAVC
ncbi:hypothetical protein [Salipiger mangrovisoli]|uniref:Uncharacterized protein n=1 Tax=Salipiger mangrovisoli TaxID=2865933 RepID=A0ABR9X1I7_9RHOB|nr:hypothetical protein [Salipiger mangrovisoli]MBE9637386.1 hypothetical protein [Salipiger mangrovisoli]